MDDLPDYQSCMRPVLLALADGEQLSVGAIRDRVADLLGVSADARDQLLPSGRQRTFDNRVGWAITYLAKAGCLIRPARGKAMITGRGTALTDSGEDVNTKRLESFEEFRDFRDGGGNGDDAAPSNPNPPGTPAAVDMTTDPEEAIEWGIGQVNDVLAHDLLDELKGLTPSQFEKAVIDVLLAMGYGGSDLDAAQQLGQSGDEGVDGVIREDPLGLSLIYIQAKRYTDNAIGRPEIQSFVGALHGKNATKGVFITTTRFTREALSYVDGLTSRVVLLDGAHLASIMIDRGVGVSTKATYEVKRVNTDYFTDL